MEYLLTDNISIILFHWGEGLYEWETLRKVNQPYESTPIGHLIDAIA